LRAVSKSLPKGAVETLLRFSSLLTDHKEKGKTETIPHTDFRFGHSKRESQSPHRVSGKLHLQAQRLKHTAEWIF